MDTNESAIIVQRGLTEINKIESEEIPIEEWKNQMVAMLRFCGGLEEGMGLLRYYALYKIQQRWDELPLAFRKSYDMSFEVFACRETGRAWNTVRNRIKTAEVFVGQRISPSLGTVRIPRRDPTGKVEINSVGNLIVEEVEWSPAMSNISKLSVVRSIAEHGHMTPKLWSMVSDPGVSVEALQTYVYAPDTTPSPVNPSGSVTDAVPVPQYTFYLEGPVLTVSFMGERIEIGELYWDAYEQDTLAQEGIRRLLRLLGITLDEEAIVKQQEAKAFKQVYSRDD